MYVATPASEQAPAKTTPVLPPSALGPQRAAWPPASFESLNASELALIESPAPIAQDRLRVRAS